MENTSKLTGCRLSSVKATFLRVSLSGVRGEVLVTAALLQLLDIYASLRKYYFNFTIFIDFCRLLRALLQVTAK